MPAAVALGQRPLRHQSGQDLLDQERDALGPPGDEFVHRGRQVGCIQAGPGHVGHRRRAKAAQRQHGGGSARRERAGQRGGFAALLISGLPEGDEAQHPFGGQVVGEVLEQRQRLPVGPVQVLQGEHAARLRGQGAQQPQHRLAEEDRRLLPRHRLRWPPLRESAVPVPGGTGRVPRWTAGGPLARPRSAPRRTAGTAWARLRPRPARPGPSCRSRPPCARPPGPAATCRSRPRRPGTPCCRGPLRPPSGRPAAGGPPRPARPGPGTAPVAQDQYRPRGHGRPI